MRVNTFAFELGLSKPLETVPEKFCLGYINKFVGLEGNWMYVEDYTNRIPISSWFRICI